MQHAQGVQFAVWIFFFEGNLWCCLNTYIFIRKVCTKYFKVGRCIWDSFLPIHLYCIVVAYTHYVVNVFGKSKIKCEKTPKFVSYAISFVKYTPSLSETGRFFVALEQFISPWFTPPHPLGEAAWRGTWSTIHSASQTRSQSIVMLQFRNEISR